MLLCESQEESLTKTVRGHERMSFSLHKLIYIQKANIVRLCCFPCWEGYKITRPLKDEAPDDVYVCKRCNGTGKSPYWVNKLKDFNERSDEDLLAPVEFYTALLAILSCCYCGTHLEELSCEVCNGDGKWAEYDTSLGYNLTAGTRATDLLRAHMVDGHLVKRIGVWQEYKARMDAIPTLSAQENGSSYVIPIEPQPYGWPKLDLMEKKWDCSGEHMGGWDGVFSNILTYRTTTKDQPVSLYVPPGKESATVPGFNMTVHIQWSVSNGAATYVSHTVESVGALKEYEDTPPFIPGLMDDEDKAALYASNEVDENEEATAPPTMMTAPQTQQVTVATHQVVQSRQEIPASPLMPQTVSSSGPNTDNLSSWLTKNWLDSFETKLREYGVSEVSDLKDLDESELEELGFKKLHKKRLAIALAGQ